MHTKGMPKADIAASNLQYVYAQDIHGCHSALNILYYTYVYCMPHTYVRRLHVVSYVRVHMLYRLYVIHITLYVRTHLWYQTS